MTDAARTTHAKEKFYAWYALGVMLLTYIIAFIDRQAVNLLVDPIKADLHLSDTQVSLLQGFAFALVLSLAGLPIGRLIDIGRRTSILATGAAFWSVMTASCGLAQSYPALLLLRAGVGAGESVMTPSALSLIGDYFPPRRLGLAISVYALGVHVGTGLALLLGAMVLGHIAGSSISLPMIGVLDGWRLVFLCLGMPGLIAALWVASLQEPGRGHAAPESSPPAWSEVFVYFRERGRVQLCANAAVGFVLMTTYGVHAWAPSFLIRHFDWTAAQAGYALGVTTIVTGVAGVLAAGVAGDAFRQRGIVDVRLIIMAACALCASPCLAFAPRLENQTLCVTLFGAANFFTAAAAGCGPAILQELSPPRMRGVTHSVAVLCVNLLALGLGPLLIALFTDRVLHDPGAVGVSLAIVPPVLAMVGCSFAQLARKPFRLALASTACHKNRLA